MPIPNRLSLQTDEHDLEILCCDDGSRTLRNVRLNETYHSGCGAVSESLWVYLFNSGVAKRLARQQTTTVVEYGFGTGTSFLLTAAFASLCKTPLRYVGLENRILPKMILEQIDLSTLFHRLSTEHSATSPVESRDLQTALQPLVELSPHRSTADFAECLQICEQTLLQAWEPAAWMESKEKQVLKLTPLIELHLVTEDAALFDAAKLAETTGTNNCDSIYFDPFAPEVSPEFWQSSVYKKMLGMLKPEGSITSYCVKGVVQREMRDVGLNVSKVPGPTGGKREVLLATS